MFNDSSRDLLAQEASLLISQFAFFYSRKFAQRAKLFTVCNTEDEISLDAFFPALGKNRVIRSELDLEIGSVW